VYDAPNSFVNIVELCPHRAVITARQLEHRLLEWNTLNASIRVDDESDARRTELEIRAPLEIDAPLEG
jgi:hypothetical protein